MKEERKGEIALLILKESLRNQGIRKLDISSVRVRIERLSRSIKVPEEELFEMAEEIFLELVEEIFHRKDINPS